MNTWQEHSATVWVICDNTQCVTAYVVHDPQTGFYNAHKNNVNLGLYTCLDAAMCACEPHANTSQALQHKIAKQKQRQDMPWDS